MSPKQPPKLAKMAQADPYVQKQVSFVGLSRLGVNIPNPGCKMSLPLGKSVVFARNDRAINGWLAPLTFETESRERIRFRADFENVFTEQNPTPLRSREQ